MRALHVNSGANSPVPLQVAQPRPRHSKCCACHRIPEFSSLAGWVGGGEWLGGADGKHTRPGASAQHCRGGGGCRGTGKHTRPSAIVQHCFHMRHSKPASSSAPAQHCIYAEYGKGWGGGGGMSARGRTASMRNGKGWGGGGGGNHPRPLSPVSTHADWGWVLL